jgi:ABC-type branched-subunit amino acid transport system ATPase component
VFEVIRAVAAEGMTVLLVEQNARLALELCARGYVMESGTITLADSASQAAGRPARTGGLSRRVAPCWGRPPQRDTAHV